ncbi:MAG: DUF5723 family protein [Mediterranea sp.]|jgi:hypothetical protein|nr:DUF5723 family protein [Mediterranea sp.]
MKQQILKLSVAALLAVTTYGIASAQNVRATFLMESTTQNHRINPAMLREGYIGFPVLGNINAGATANIGMKNFIFPTENNSNYPRTTFMHPSVSADDFLSKLNSLNKLNVNADFSLLSVAFRAFKGINLVELNVRSNTSIALPYELFDFMKQAGKKEFYSFSDLGIHSQNYVELALGHSHAITKDLTVGAKLKLLIGGGYADLNVKRMDITMTDDYWTINADAQQDVSILDSRFKIEMEAANGKYKVEGVDDIKFGLAGMGAAIDLGAVYKFPRYLVDGLTVSASVLDLGFISWDKTNRAVSSNTYTFEGFKDPIYIGEEGDNGQNNTLHAQLDALSDDLEKMFSFYDEGRHTVTSMLAATVNVGVNYEMPFYRRLSAGLLYTQRIQGNYSWSQATLLANVRPLKWIEASANIAYSSLSDFSAGGVLSLRAPHFNFFIGADYAFGKLSEEGIPLNKVGANVSMGISFPL